MTDDKIDSVSRPLHGLCREFRVFPSDESLGYFQSCALADCLLLQACQLFDVIVHSVAECCTDHRDLFQRVQEHQVIEEWIVWFTDGRLSE
jgi:hypothetical protein